MAFSAENLTLRELFFRDFFAAGPYLRDRKCFQRWVDVVDLEALR